MRTKVIFFLTPTEATKTKLQKYTNDNGLDTTEPFAPGVPFTFHCTLISSKNEIDIAGPSKSILSRNISVYPEKMICLGKTKNIPCVELSDDDRSLEGLRFIISKQYKLFDEYENYIPHISLSYKGNLTEDQIKALPLPNFRIDFDGIECQEVKTASVSPVKKFTDFISKLF